MSMQLNLYRLRIFMEVVERRGFSAAAHKLYMSQPSVSNQVRLLEQSLNARLIDRSGSRIRPTAQGEVLMEYGTRVFQLADEAVNAVAQVGALQSGRVVVGGTTTVGTYLLPALTARFRAEYPGVECDIVVGNAATIGQSLLSGEVAIAVVAGEPAASQLISERVLTDRLVLIAAPDHPLAGRLATPIELSGEHFLVREPGSQTRDLQLQTLERWGIAGIKRTDVWGPETIKQAVAAGLGLSLISEHAVTYERAGGRLAVIDIRPPVAERPVVATRRRDRLLSPAEQAFLNLLRDTGQWPLEPFAAALPRAGL